MLQKLTGLEGWEAVSMHHHSLKADHLRMQHVSAIFTSLHLDIPSAQRLARPLSHSLSPSLPQMWR